MTEQVPLTTSPLPYRLTVEGFFRLDEAGAFAGYGKTELIRGEVFYRNAQHRPHARAKIPLYARNSQDKEGRSRSSDPFGACCQFASANFLITAGIMRNPSGR